MDDLRRRLDELKIAAPAPTPHPIAAPPPTPTPLADVIGGQIETRGRLACWRVETEFQHTCARHDLAFPEKLQGLYGQFAWAPVGGLDPRRTLVLDIETGGFAGTEVFLIGIVPLDSRPLRVVQLLARDYPEEEAILDALAALAPQRESWVTFNGRAFDEPFLRERAARWHVTLPPLADHVDLLQSARRRLRGQVPNCKLQTLETHLLGWQRVGDVPGADIPDLFHHFIRTGNAGPLRPVIEHNQLDLISCTELLLRLT